MPLTLNVSLQGYTDLRALKAELAQAPSYDAEDVIAWAQQHPESAWAKHLARHSARVLVEYVHRLIEVVVVIDKPEPRRLEVAARVEQVKPAKESRLHRNVKPVLESERRPRLKKFFLAFAPLRLAYADAPELQGLFAEAERIRKEFNIF